MYQELVRQLKFARTVYVILGVLLTVVFAVLGFMLGNYIAVGIVPVIIGTALPLVLGIPFLIKQFTLGASLKKMQRIVGAGSDSEMNEILEKAVMLRERYFFTREYVINYITLRAYPLNQVKKVSAYNITDDENRSNGYGLRITVEGYPNDKMVFDSGAECIQAREELEG